MKKSLPAIGLLSLLLSTPAFSGTKFDDSIVEADKVLRQLCELSAAEVRAEGEAKFEEFKKTARGVSGLLKDVSGVDLLAKVSELNARNVRNRARMAALNDQYISAGSEAERDQVREKGKPVTHEFYGLRKERSALLQDLETSSDWKLIQSGLKSWELNLTLDEDVNGNLFILLWGPDTSARLEEGPEKIKAVPISFSNLEHKMPKECHHYRDLEKPVGQIKAPEDLSVNNQPVKMLETPAAPQPKPVKGSIPAEESGGGKL